MPELIITEKPSTAQKIAAALADKKPEAHKEGKVSYYTLSHGGKEITVACAVGHLFGLAEKNKKGWGYPVFDVEWKPVYVTDKKAKHTKAYIDIIKTLSKGVKEFTIGTDFDVEGEVIGYNILRFICNKHDARRMKFSTTTSEDLLEAYEHAWPHIDQLQADAGLTRHTLDFYYGINLSRALTLSVKQATGMFKILSSGRVQGPALKILADREKEIMEFIPVPFWRVELITPELSAFHINDRFWKKGEADAVLEKTRGQKAIVDKLERKQFQQEPPHPFDLTALQIEAHKQFGISPKETLDIAQSLYTNSYISYPRTSANQLPPTIGYHKLLMKISKIPEYAELCKELLKKKELKPNNGDKTDRAHPAIYCTGENPKTLKEREAKIFDLIARRTLASFSDPATRETMSVLVDVNGEKFETRGTRTVIPGWHKVYGPYAKFEEIEMPSLQERQELEVKEIKRHDLETSPPKRYTTASLIKVLESKNLGTKATRSEIIDHLFRRNYVSGQQAIEVTDLGLATVKTLEKYCPEIIDESLTAQIEQEMEDIREQKKKGEEIIEEVRAVLTKVLAKFKDNETKIGESLSKATIETRQKESIVGKCGKCGSDLRILFSKRFHSHFVACCGYPECKTTYSLPQGLPKPTEKFCPECNFPMVMIIRAGKRPFDYCINKMCPNKVRWREEQEKKKAAALESQNAVAGQAAMKPKRIRKKATSAKKEAPLSL